MIDVRALWKVFGADTASALRLGAEGAERSTIQTATGRTVGVRDVSFAVAEGETVVVMGLSGSGKSTLIRCLSGPHDITSGEVTIDGQGVVGIPADSFRSLRRSKLLRLQLELRRTIVFITHDFAETIRLGDRIAVMKDGVLEQIGTPEMVVTHPATPYVHAFTRDVPRLKVIRAHTIMRTAAGASSLRSVAPDTLAENLIPLFLEVAGPIGVVDASGSLLGMVTINDFRQLVGDDAPVPT